MKKKNFNDVFTPAVLEELFPNDRTNQFFEALFGDAEEGAYDISLEFIESSSDTLKFEFHMKQRPGKCLACNLTYGLPQVFSRHPIINIKGLIENINTLLNGKARCADWKLGATQEISHILHVIPFVILLDT